MKRYRMLRPAKLPQLPVAPLPIGLRALDWQEGLLDWHAEAKYHSFYGETDALIFPNLGNWTGCRLLMRSIRQRDGFAPSATWLIVDDDAGPVATIQGVVEQDGSGSIQNLGVVPRFRGLGLGKALLTRTIAGFAQVGAKEVTLEVTVGNEVAVRLYRSYGFRNYKVIYKHLPNQTYPPPEGLIQLPTKKSTMLPTSNSLDSKDVTV